MKEQIIQKIEQELESLTLENKVEILANLFIREGLSYMECPSSINTGEVLELLIQNKKEHGETIANALVSQGLVILAWLDKE